jgi:hypothetical protein
MELSGWTRSSRGVPAQSTAAAGAHRIRMGSRCRGRTERQGSGKGSGTGRFVLAGSGSDAPEYAHSLHSTTEGAHRAGSRLRTIARRSVISRRGKIEEMKSAAVTWSDKRSWGLPRIELAPSHVLPSSRRSDTATSLKSDHVRFRSRTSTGGDRDTGVGEHCPAHHR